MATAWVKVVVLTLSECVAPEGKTVCQEQEVQHYFVEEAHCQVVLEQLIEHRNSRKDVIVNADKSSCLPTIKNLEVFGSKTEADSVLAGIEGYGVLPAEPARKDYLQVRHEERLATLPECGDDAQVVPCKRGEIIIEGATAKQGEVWKQQN